MSKSELRTKVAVLRSVIGLSVGEFAALVGKSPYTIKSLESGRLKLSKGLAILISKKTGVALRWLLDETQTGPPFTRDNEPFTKESYDRHAASVMAKIKDAQRNQPEFLGDLLTQLLKALEDHPDFPLAVYRTESFMSDLMMEFRAREPAEQQTKPKKAAGSKKKRP
jgi:transcriptional regulator with XRE-family HTH domain